MKQEQKDRWHGDLLACDPSVNSPGVALFRGGALRACTRIKIDKAISKLDRGARALRVAQEIGAWWQTVCGGASAHPIRTLVYEWPQVYAPGKGKGDPKNLLGLIAVGQSLAVFITAGNIACGVRPPELLTPEPDEWVRQLPKSTKGGESWTSPRGRRVKAHLEPGEFELVPAQHDAIDGLALGLWGLGRFDPRRVFAGAAP